MLAKLVVQSTIISQIFDLLKFIINVEFKITFHSAFLNYDASLEKNKTDFIRFNLGAFPVVKIILKMPVSNTKFEVFKHSLVFH